MPGQLAQRRQDVFLGDGGRKREDMVGADPGGNGSIDQLAAGAVADDGEHFCLFIRRRTDVPADEFSFRMSHGSLHEGSRRAPGRLPLCYETGQLRPDPHFRVPSSRGPSA